VPVPATVHAQHLQRTLDAALQAQLLTKKS